MHTFYIKYFEHPSVHPQKDLYVHFYGISFLHPYKSIKHILPSTLLHVQVFLRMNTWIFETCRRHYNYIKTLR